MFDDYSRLHEARRPARDHGRHGRRTVRLRARREARVVSSRDQIVAALGRPNRVFAIAPQTELCQLHREIGGKPYFVLDDRNVRSLLLSNRVDRHDRQEPAAHRDPARGAQADPGAAEGHASCTTAASSCSAGRLPKRVGRGDRFEVKLFYKILQPVGGNWRVLMHFDGAAALQRRPRADQRPLPDLDLAARRLHRRYVHGHGGRRQRSRPARTRSGPASSPVPIPTGRTWPSRRRLPRDARQPAPIA